MLIATALSVTISKSSESNKNELMGIVFSGVPIAMVTTIPLVTFITGKFSWQYSFMFQTLANLIALCFIYFGFPNMPVMKKKSYNTQLSILKRSTFIISTTMNFFMISAWFSIYSYFAEYLNKVKDMNSVIIGYMFFIFGVIGVLANFIAGKMLKKKHIKDYIVFSYGPLIIPFLLVFSNSNIWVMCLIIGIWGFLYSSCFLNTSTYMISVAPEAMEFANSLATSFGNLEVTVGTTVGGWIIIIYGVECIPWLTLGFGILAISMIFIRWYVEKKQVYK